MLFSCVKQNDIPSKTREGKNTFGYSVDGEYIGGQFDGSNDIIIFQDSTIEITHGYDIAKLQSYEKEWKVNIVLKEKEVNLFVLDQASFHARNVMGNSNNYSNSWIHYTEVNDNPNNFLDVTYFSATKRILSGEFYLNLVQLDSTLMNDSIWVVKRRDSVELNRGRFDLRF